jgi:cytochrome c peroxidase
MMRTYLFLGFSALFIGSTAAAQPADKADKKAEKAAEKAEKKEDKAAEKAEKKADKAAEKAEKKADALPLGLPEIPAPPDNPLTADKIALGKQLFYDGRLSKSGKTSCLTCHLPEKGWADGLKVSKKDDGTLNTRHTPTLLNTAYNTSFYWDGRAPTLEKQIAAAWRGQMGLKDDAGAAEAAKTIGGIKGYAEAFQKVFGEAPSPDNIVKALAAFTRTIVSGASKLDRFEAGDQKALSAAEKRGLELFRGKAKCSLCHAGALLTAWEFKNIGIGMNQPNPDPGRGKIEATNPAMTGAFKVPSLRSVSKHPPYMHDGSLATLAAVVDYFEKPVESPHLDEKIKGGMPLTPAEKKDLLAFLKALDGTQPDAKRPKLPK